MIHKQGGGASPPPCFRSSKSSGWLRRVRGEKLFLGWENSVPACRGRESSFTPLSSTFKSPVRLIPFRTILTENKSPTMPRLSQVDLIDLNRTFEERTPEELLQWSQEIFGDRLAALSSMQRAGCVICHMLQLMPVKMPVLFVDTGVLFEESLATRDRIVAEYGLEVRTLTPEKTMEQQTSELGVLYLSAEGQKECCEIRKSAPLDSVKNQYDCLIGSLRRADGGQRGSCPILAVDPRLNVLRVNPLVNFTDEQMDEYAGQKGVVTNPLHDQGYSTIGCNRCTTPVLPGEPHRAGRWRHLGPWSVYCGINPSDLGPERSPAVDLPQDLVDRILGRSTDYMI